MRRRGYANIGQETSRGAADQETDSTVSETLLEIAEAYEKLAALAEAKLTS
jgi:hypothetical protein